MCDIVDGVLFECMHELKVPQARTHQSWLEDARQEHHHAHSCVLQRPVPRGQMLASWPTGLAFRSFRWTDRLPIACRWKRDVSFKLQCAIMSLSFFALIWGGHILDPGYGFESDPGTNQPFLEHLESRIGAGVIRLQSVCLMATIKSVMCQCILFLVSCAHVHLSKESVEQVAQSAFAANEEI